MNTVIFITKENKKEMETSIRLLAEKQEAKINGALIISHQSSISVKEVGRICSPLVKLFTTGAMIQSSANHMLSHKAQIASMLSKFVMLAYSRYPGPWLIIDEPTNPKVSNWAAAAMKLYSGCGRKVCGRAATDGKTLLSYGPIIIGIPLQAMKLFRFSTGECWRARGRYLLVGHGFHVVSDDEAVFEPIPDDGAESLPPNASAEREQLANLIQEATGKRPHHMTGLDKLRETAQSLSQPTQV